MSMGYKNLEECCGGTINPELLRRFQLAMVEYKEFMHGLGQLLGPKKENDHDDAR